jgi:hypothetical protein
MDLYCSKGLLGENFMDVNGDVNVSLVGKKWLMVGVDGV